MYSECTDCDPVLLQHRLFDSAQSAFNLWSLPFLLLSSVGDMSVCVCVSYHRLKEPIFLRCKYSTGKNSLHAFRNNSAESEPICMKSVTVWAKCGRSALADFGCDPRSSCSMRGIVFPKTQKLLTKLSDFATSGRHKSAMITDRRKFTAKWSLYGMSSFHFTVTITSKSFLWAEKVTYTNFRQSLMVTVDVLLSHDAKVNWRGRGSCATLHQ